MEGTIGEVRLFAANFAPRNWAYCQGQIYPIQQNTALFSILGTTYGGNGTSTFGLPNLSDSVAVGAGTGPGLSERLIGDIGGANAITLDVSQLPAHTHALKINPSMSVSSAAATTPAPVAGTSTIAKTVLSNATDLLSYTASTPDIAMNAGTVTASLSMQQRSPVGNSVAHGNQQPSLGLAFIICQYGVFPQRP